MKVEMSKNGLMIVPETEFEINWLQQFGNNSDDKFKAFHKHGMTTADYVGLKIIPEKE
jgi:hypothetical protein